MSPFKQARAHYLAISGDGEKILAVVNEHLALLEKWQNASGGMQISQGSEMGQSFAATWSRSEEERLHYLSFLVGMIRRGNAGSNHITPSFA